MKKLKQIPKFKNEADEDKFWATHDSTEYVDWTKVVVNPIFPNPKPSTKTITIRVSESLLNSLKVIANKKDVPYQSLVKIFLDERVKEESQVKHAPSSLKATNFSLSSKLRSRVI